jgi:hypothetical protein
MVLPTVLLLLTDVDQSRALDTDVVMVLPTLTRSVMMVLDLSDVLLLVPEPSVVMVFDKLPLPTMRSVITVPLTPTPTPQVALLSVLSTLAVVP